MKQQQILAITLVLLVQQLFFVTAANSDITGPPVLSSSDVAIKSDVFPTTVSSTSLPTTSPTTTTTTPTTTPTPITTQSTSTTIIADKPPQPQPTTTPRHFDLPSFIGGIVLTIGLIGIGFVGHKIYKSKFDRNYHTL